MDALSVAERGDGGFGSTGKKYINIMINMKGAGAVRTKGYPGSFLIHI